MVKSQLKTKTGTTPRTIRLESGKSKLEVRTFGKSRMFEIVNTRGKTDKLNGLVTKVKSIAPREITTKVDPGNIEMIKFYLKKGFTSKIRYEDGKISMTHVKGKSKVTSLSKNKVLQKIYNILDAVLKDEYVPIQVTLDPKFLMEIEGLLRRNSEFGGLLRLSDKKYSISKRSYKFLAKKSKIEKGPDNSFKATLPNRLVDRKEFISFHTHPSVAFIKNAACVLPPSIPDYHVAVFNSFYYNEPAHIVFTPEAIYTIEVIREVRALGRRLTLDEKATFINSLLVALNTYLSKSFDLCFFSGDVTKAIRNAGGDVRKVGSGSKSKYEVFFKGTIYKFDNIFEIIKASTEEGIFKFDLSELRSRRSEYFKNINEHVFKVNLANMKINDIIKKYGIPEEKTKNPIFNISVHAIDAGGDFFTHNYTKPVVMTIYQDIRLMKRALSISPKSLSWMSSS